MPYADPMDPTTPADNDVVSFGDDRIREFKRGLIQRLSTVFQNTDAQPLAFIAGIVPGSAVAALGIDTAQLALQAVTAAQILNGTITSTQLAAAAVASVNIAAGAVNNAALAALAIATGNLQDGAVTDAKISAVSGLKVNAGTLPGTALAAGAVGTSQIAAGGVSTANIAALAVDSAHIANGAVGSTQLAATSVDVTNLTGALKNLLMIGKSVAYPVAAQVVFTRSVYTLTTVALSGVVAGDAVLIGIPPEVVAFTDASTQGSIGYLAFSGANSVTLRLRNNNDGPLNIPACTFTLTVVKSATAWGY